MTNLDSLESRRGTWLAGRAITAAAIAVYANSISGAFIFDDYLWIVSNPCVHQLCPLSEVIVPSFNSMASGRPVLNLTIAVNYALSGTDPRSYHIVNIGIHILGALTLFGILRRTLAMPVLRDRFGTAATPVALAVVLVWVVHPLGTAAVTYIIQRTEALASLFYLLTLYCVIRGATSARPARWHMAAVATCLFGMGTKEIMVTAPVVILFYDRTFLSGSFGNAVRRRGGLYLAMAATWGVVAWCLISTGFHSGTVGFGNKDFTSISYAATQPGVVVHYLELAVWPVGLSLDYGWPVATSIGEVLLPALIVAALIGLTIWGVVGNSPLGFLGVWFFAILAPTSSIVPIKDAAFDHRMYLPLIALATLVVIGGFGLSVLLLASFQRAHAGTIARRWFVPVGLLAAVLIGLGWRTVRRNENYKSAVAIWRNAVDQFPNNSRAHNNLAAHLLDEGEVDEAVAHCRWALRLTPHYADAEALLGFALARQHKLDEAIPHFREALRINPLHSLALENLDNAMFDKKQTAAAIVLYRQHFAIDPDNPEARRDVARVPRNSRDSTAPLSYLAWKVEIDPEFAKTLDNLSHLMGGKTNLSEAIKRFELMLNFETDQANAHFGVGKLFFRQGKIAEAESHWRAAVGLRPTRIEYLHRLAWVLATSTDASNRSGAEAAKLAKRAVDLCDKPDPAIIDTLAASYAEQGRFSEAVEAAKQALEVAFAQRQNDLVHAIRERIKYYRTGKPFHKARD
jgi:protein O-mannosyl-transferase